VPGLHRLLRAAACHGHRQKVASWHRRGGEGGSDRVHPCRPNRTSTQLRNINTPLELAINNEIDRFSLAMDVIDRVPRLRAAGAHAKEKLRNRQIECRNYAYQHGIDAPEAREWTWPL
jgi:phosphoketolase